MRVVLIAFLFLFTALCCTAQQGVLVVFPEDANFKVPTKFIKNKVGGVEDSTSLRLLTLKYLFYNNLSERLVANNFTPFGGVNGTVEKTYRTYTKGTWEYYTGEKKKKKHSKSYFSSVIKDANKNYYTLHLQNDSAQYLLVVNKITVHAPIIRKWFFMYNYLADIHFDVYDKDMNHLGGRYLRKKMRLHKDMYWSAFSKQFSGLGDELALYFANNYKKK